MIFSTIHGVGPSGGSYPRDETYADTSARATGRTPIAVIVKSIAVASDDVSATAPRTGIGFCDGTNQRAVAICAEHGALTAGANAAKFADNTKLIVVGLSGGTTTPAATASFVSFDVNEITLNWDAASGVDFDLILIYAEGSESAQVGTLTGNATQNSTAAITGMSGTPFAIFAVGAGDLAFSAGGASVDAVMSYGFAGRLPSTTQACTAIVWEDAKATATSVGNVARSNRLATSLASAAGTVTEGASLEVTAWNSDGATLTTRDAAGSIQIAYLALVDGNRKAVAVHPTLPTTSTGAFSRTDIGFQPMALFFSCVRNTSVESVGNAQGAMFHGFAFSTQEGCSAFYWRDNVGTSNGYGRHTQSYAGTLILAATGGLYFRFTHDSFTSTGWDGTVETAAGTDIRVAYLGIEDNVRVISAETEQISDATAISVSQATADTEQIGDEVAISGAGTQVTAETEAISDATALALALSLSDTEEISDAVVLSGAATVVSGDTEEISDQVALMLALALNETVEIGDACVLIAVGSSELIVCDETVEISDSCVLVELAMVDETIVVNETVEISEQVQLVGSVMMVVNETVEISEATYLYLGYLIVCDETVEISDDCAFASRRRLAGWRGTTLVGGAPAGWSHVAGSKRGTSRG